MRTVARPTSLIAALLATVGLGCGQLKLPVDLALEEPSELTLELPTETATTSLVGGVSTTIKADLGLLKLLGALVGKALVANVQVDDVLIAGTSVSILGGFINTGTICLFQDPEVPSSGSAAFNILLGTAAFDMSLNSLLAVTDPVLSGLVGGPQPFSQDVSAVVPLSLADLVGIIAGSGGGLAITQEIDTVFGPVPIIGEIHVTGALTLASTDTPPSDPLLDECADFIASLP